MEEESLTASFRASIISNISDAVLDTTEITLDSVLEDGILKEIPLVKYAVTTFKIIKNVQGRFYLKKLIRFIDSFNRGVESEENIKKYKEIFSGKNKEKELEYVLVVVDKYLEIGKVEILAKLFLSFLDNDIGWEEFCAYSEILDKILIHDLEWLKNKDNYKINTKYEIIPAELLRLSGVGLMYSYQNDSAFSAYEDGGMAIFPDAISRVQNKEKAYFITGFGQKLKEII